ncbi:uncharacterized protein LOC106178581 [Lingula anatina]|uniref:Uncharacterized protein LOC106178581 n=1 Tax=Lingula anatina TaxID=7574 RepID=A0A1S3K414_LINAN|nr:uncharacterized protein LOC106178581 [Lingula anatina]|eukprot:XP_013417267.1 uncharacterized protein LOC106178581 [Lingula anatina]
MVKMSTNLFALTAAQASYEQRFNCIICWNPKLRMVYGSCQHRVCEECLYNEVGKRRRGLSRCPTCQREDAFPVDRPDIPEDNVEMQKRLGVIPCPNSGCDIQTWEWELEEHLSHCPLAKQKIKSKPERKSQVHSTKRNADTKSKAALSSHSTRTVRHRHSVRVANRERALRTRRH